MRSILDRLVSFSAVSLLMFSVSAHSEQLVTQVTDNIFMLSGKGGNIGVMIGEDGTFIIDDQYAPATTEILEAIKSNGGQSPQFLMNTHFHGDHTGGNENIGRSGTLIMAHDNVRKRLLEGYTIERFSMNQGPAEKEALPVVTFNDEMSLHINGDSLRAHYVANAHTDGDSVIVFTQANVIHTGDIFFNGFYPFIDVPHGGSLSGMISAVDVILAMTNDTTKIMPGHGPLATVQDLQNYRAMLATAHQRLLVLKQAGKSLEQAQLAAPLADLQKQWGQVMFDSSTWIGVVYDGLN